MSGGVWMKPMKPVAFIAVALFLGAPLALAIPFHETVSAKSVRPSCDSNVGAFSTTDTLRIALLKHWTNPDLTIRVKVCKGEPGEIPICASLGKRDLDVSPVDFQEKTILEVTGQTLHSVAAT